MAATQPAEWRDINDDRSFPFSENGSLMDQDGAPLPQGALVDAILYPIDAVGGVYLSRLDPVAAVAEISATSTGTVLASGEITGADTIYLYDGDGRPAGVLVKGSKFDRVITPRSFTAKATPFAAACLFPQNQPGVRAFRLPDGRLVTGAVLFVGENGYTIDTSVVGGKVTVRPDAVGVDASLNCTQLPPPVKCLRVSQAANSILTIQQVLTAAGVVYQLGARVVMDDLCPPKRIPDSSGVLPPPPIDPCVPPTPPPPPPPPTPPTPASACVTGNGRAFIVPINSLLAVNPATEPAAAGVPLESASVESLSKILDLLPPRESQGIEIRLKGWTR
jgi:hypothetical protein